MNKFILCALLNAFGVCSAATSEVPHHTDAGAGTTTTVSSHNISAGSDNLYVHQEVGKDVCTLVVYRPEGQAEEVKWSIDTKGKLWATIHNHPPQKTMGEEEVKTFEELKAFLERKSTLISTAAVRAFAQNSGVKEADLCAFLKGYIKTS